MTRICVYCGSSLGFDPGFGTGFGTGFELASQALGKLLATEGISLVYGDFKIGLIEAPANNAVGLYYESASFKDKLGLI